MLKTIFLVAFLILAGASQPVLSADKNDPKAAKADEKKQGTENISQPILSSKQEITATKERQATKEQPQRPFTDFSSWIRWVFWETVGSVEKFFTFWVAIFTLVVAIFTGLIVCEARDRGKKELRAYVGFEDIFFQWEDRNNPNSNYTDTFRLRFKNHGVTPGLITSIKWKRRKPKIPVIGFNPDDMEELKDFGQKVIDPGQRFGRWFPPDEHFLHKCPEFFTYGRIVYRDIYYRWWVHRFCYIYNFHEGKSRGGRGDGVFTPYGDYNREDGPYKTDPEAKTIG